RCSRHRGLGWPAGGSICSSSWLATPIGRRGSLGFRRRMSSRLAYRSSCRHSVRFRRAATALTPASLAPGREPFWTTWRYRLRRAGIGEIDPHALIEKLDRKLPRQQYQVEDELRESGALAARQPAKLDVAIGLLGVALDVNAISGALPVPLRH